MPSVSVISKDNHVFLNDAGRANRFAEFVKGFLLWSGGFQARGVHRAQGARTNITPLFGDLRLMLCALFYLEPRNNRCVLIEKLH